MNRVKVSLNTAAEFAAQGFVVECFVVSSPSEKKGRKLGSRVSRFTGSQMNSTTILTLSLDGKTPNEGALAEHWAKTKKRFWAKNVTRQVTRQLLVDYFLELGASTQSASSNVSHLVYHFKCLRRVEPE